LSAAGFDPEAARDGSTAASLAESAQAERRCAK
jgi:hypothetical protein